MASPETSQSSPSKNENSSHNTEKSVSGNSLKSAFKTFAQQITIKLDDSNFLSWKQQVECIIRIHKLHRHLTNPDIPPRYLTVDDRASDVKNLAYHAWQKEDSLRFTWLLTTLSDSLLPHVVKCVHTH